MQSLAQRGVDSLRAVAQATASALPTGHALARADWQRRHDAICWLLWLHVVVVPIYGLLRGQHLPHALLEASLIAVLAAGATWREPSVTSRSVMATLGLVSASALLTHFSGGLIEMHFHFFVVVAVVSLYQSWVPFLTALAFVVLHHALGGLAGPGLRLQPRLGAERRVPWALIHGGFILAESAACLVAWRLNEVALENERGARRALEKAHRDLAAAQALSSIGSWDWHPEPERTWWSDELFRIWARDPGAFAAGAARPSSSRSSAEDRERVAYVIDAPCAATASSTSSA